MMWIATKEGGNVHYPKKETCLLVQGAQLAISLNDPVGGLDFTLKLQEQTAVLR